MKYVQDMSFCEELSGLSKSVARDAHTQGQTRACPIKKSSPIYKLDPKLEKGLLCVGRRLRNAPIPTETKHSLILPKNHHISILIARYYVISGHSDLEHVLSLIREKFWIVGARATLRRILMCQL